MIQDLQALSPIVAVVFLFLIFLWKAGIRLAESLDKLTDAQRDSTKATERLVVETRKGNEEAAERNGHLGEQNIQIIEYIGNHTEKMAREFSRVGSKLDKQVVREQTVEHQTLKED